MAEAVIGSIAETIVGILVPQALEKVGELRGVKRELEALKDTISALQAVLEDAEEQYSQSHQIRDWVKKLKDAFYEAHDVVEEFTIEAMRRELRGHNEMMKKVSTFFSSSNQLVFKWKMSSKVRAVRKKIKAITTDKELHLNEHPKREWRNREDPHSLVLETDMKGRDREKEEIMEFLRDSNVEENVSILSIVGIGGLGKTALANNVYNYSNFDLKTWVCVSNGFDEKNIVKEIIACAKKNEPTKVPTEQLQSELKAAIDKKRCLLVLDDLWDVKQVPWPRLKALLLGSARGSKILITTRFSSIAEITDIRPYHLRGLSESASLDLLLQWAGREKEEIQDPYMLAICQEIVRKCSGVPLVVCSVGNVLSFKKTIEEWSQFKDYKLPDVCQREESIVSVLRLSYDHLPSHLKQCFAFCSLFPKDYEIEKQTLVDLWVAEGFVQPSNRSQHLEDIAHEYFMDLLWSNFFQDYQKDKGTCKMHDLMHDLASLVAGTECWVSWDDDTRPIDKRTRHISVGNLPIVRLKASPLRTILSIMPRERSEADLRQLIQSSKRLRILDMHKTHVEKVPRSICQLKHLTYLDLSDNEELRRLPNSITKLQNLQTLKLYGCRSLEELPGGIWKLVSLRNLDLSYNGKLRRLPNSITRLQNLQTLNLNGCRSLEELPRDIRKLVSLRNLDISGCSELSYMPCGLGQLTSLQKLTHFILPKEKALVKNYCKLGELNGLNNIRGSLCIENLGSVTDAVVESKATNLLIGKHSLESLTLNWGNFDTDDVVIGDRDEGNFDTDDAVIGDRDDAVIGDRDEAVLDGLRPNSNLQELNILGYKGESFPGWLTSLCNLVELCLRGCKRCKNLPPLGQLSHLKSLYIIGLTELEYIESTISFPSLSELNIVDCEKLKGMPLAPHPEDLKLEKANAALINQILGLNKLKSLYIDNLKFLECLPEEGLKSLTSLESLWIVGCPQLKSLSLGMRHLSNLMELTIWNCEELDLSKDESGNILDFQRLQSLCGVDIRSLTKLEFLPRWLLQVSNLEKLKIENCVNLKDFPGQIEAFQSLRSLEIIECPSLTSLSEEFLQSLTSLQSLQIFYCPRLTSSLTSLSEEFLKSPTSLDSLIICHCPRLTSLPLGMRHLSNLTYLSIWDCEELDLSKDESGNILDFQGLQSLREVKILELPKLASLPQWLLQVSNLEKLKISNCDNLKDFPGQIEAFQSLRSLEIDWCPSLTSLPEEFLKSLTSLEYLIIGGCHRLTSLPLGRRLLNLTGLRISNCEELDLSKDENGNILDFQGLQSLQTVDIEGLPKLASLPQWLLRLSNLKELEISDCSNLKELPEQIEALQSLQNLKIVDCPSLTSLPEGMRMLTSLNYLHIWRCPELEKRCKEDAGEDWCKIAHIPNISVFGTDRPCKHRSILKLARKMKKICTSSPRTR